MENIIFWFYWIILKIVKLVFLGIYNIVLFMLLCPLAFSSILFDLFIPNFWDTHFIPMIDKLCKHDLIS